MYIAAVFITAAFAKRLFDLLKPLITCFVGYFGAEGGTNSLFRAVCGALICHRSYLDRRGKTMASVVIISTVYNIAVDTIGFC